jgi:NAD dependent epimerase/dehydratase family enzyme
LQSRIVSNEGIKKLVNHLKNPPKQIFIASGVGYYGFSRDEVVDESSPIGDGFLADVAFQLEQIWCDSKIKPIFMRFATVLSFYGGALDKISLPWRLRLCPFYGSRNNYFPLITRCELVKMILFLLGKSSVFGPVNFCTLKPYKQVTIFQRLAAVFKPMVSFTIPTFLIKFLLGQMGVETLLVNLKIFPRKLYELKYDFSDDGMFSQLAEELKKTENSD